MRNAISPDTMAFKREANQSCVLCGSTHNLHTDHSSISFKTISTDFLFTFFLSAKVRNIPTKIENAMAIIIEDEKMSTNAAAPSIKIATFIFSAYRLGRNLM